MALLDIRNLHVYYGKIHALRGVSLSVDSNQIVTLIGANGAGKTTTLRAISGILAASEGEVTFDGQPLRDLQAHEVVGRRIVQVPEGRRIFSRLTVAENLRIGAFLNDDKKWIADRQAHVLGMFPVLKERIRQVAGTLSGGEQQMLAIGRALMTRPRLLMLDEPSQGIMPKLVDEIFQAVKRIRDAGMTVLIVEQRMTECLEIADRAYILQTGRVLMQGAASEIMGNPDVRKAYLGL